MNCTAAHASLDANHDYLCLRLARLDPGEEWVSNANGLHFLFPTEGAAQCPVGNGSQPLLPGDVFVFQAPLPGKLCVAQAGELVFSWFSTLAEHLFPLFATNELCLVRHVMDIFRASRHYPAASPLAGECHKLIGNVAPQFNLDHRSQLLKVTGTILSTEFRNAQVQGQGAVPGADALTRALENLSVSEILDLRVSELAQKFNCGQRHLNRLFHRHFGISAAALRMEMRLLKAACLLRDPEAKVITVAEQCGFNHLGLFNICFKRRFGTSPSHWRGAVPGVELPHANPPTDNPQCRLLDVGLCPWAGKPAGAQTTSPKPARLIPSQLQEARSPVGPPAPQRRDASLEAAVRTKLGNAVRAKLGAASRRTSEKGRGL